MICNQAYRCIELFAGVGAISRMMRFANVATASVDIAYGKNQFQHKEMNPMDLCSPAGFAFPGFKCMLHGIPVIWFLCFFKATTLFS